MEHLTSWANLFAEPQPEAAMLLGQLTDCDPRPIANAEVRVFGDAGEIAFGAARTGPRRFHFDGSAGPVERQERTHVDGLFGAVNVPAGPMRLELWGSRDGASVELLACESIEGVSDGVTYIDIGLARADGPADCGD